MEAEIERVKPLLAHCHGRVHLMGVCGMGMAGLAFHLKHRGFQVTGCDNVRNAISDWLEKQGVSVIQGHDSAHITGVDWIIRSNAVRLDHPELGAAAAAGIPVFRRGMVLAALLSAYTSVAVSGAHGKTTTSSMIAQVLQRGGLSPSFCIGGETAVLGGVAGAGTGAILVAEADESDGTLAVYAPDIAVITNIEFDHAEHFENVAAVQACFSGLIRRVKRRLIYCADDPQARALCREQPHAVSYGLEGPVDWLAADISESGNSIACWVTCRGIELGRLVLPVPGRHNLLNALAACAVAVELNIKFPEISAALRIFEPVRRRFERVVATEDILVISDYAHHPSEVAAVLSNLKYIPRSRWLVVFQPHRFSRTQVLGKDFAEVFQGVDELILAPVYAASEPALAGGTSWDLYAHFRRAGKVRTVYAISVAQAWDYLRRRLVPGDGLLIIGAGDVGQMAGWVKKDIEQSGIDRLNPAQAWVEDLAKLELESTLIRVGEPLDQRTTLHVGGKADIFMEISSPADLGRVVPWADHARVPLTVLGAGSNILASDLGVRGLVVRLTGAAFRGIRGDGSERVIAGAGVPLKALMQWTIEQGRTGVEFLTGIPGTVGGALRMNAGAWNREIGEVLEWVRCLNPDGLEQIVDKSGLDLAYRECRGLAGRIILEAALRVKPDDSSAIQKRMKDMDGRRAWMNGLRSAGSVFRNPEGDFAGRLIEQAGFKGYRIGGACVSEQHANVIITETGATASDVLALVEIVRHEVRNRWGVALIKEIVCLE